MATFHTPEPITAVVEVVAGAVYLAAADRDDTVVDVRPRDPERASDVRAAEQARVDFHDGTLTVTAGRKVLSLGRGGAVRVDIALPARSRLDLSSASADVDADGVYSDFRFASASGALRVATVAGNLKADTASGDVSIGDLAGNARLATASGDVTIDRIDGDVKFQAASGGLSIGTLRGHVKHQSASGSVAVAVGVTGALSAQTGSGEVEVGIPEGTAARLELKTHSGTIDNGLQASGGPVDGDETLMVHARTGSGDISIRRALHSTVPRIAAT
jgi:Putative adhesin